MDYWGGGGGGPKGMFPPPLKLLGGAWLPLAPPLPTPMSILLFLAKFDYVPYVSMTYHSKQQSWLSIIVICSQGTNLMGCDASTQMRRAKI